jgi:hypothetical protein
MRHTYNYLILSNNPLEVFMPSTGDICQTSGLYKVLNHDVRHPKEITMVKGKQFPPCRDCGQKVQYQLVTATPH